MKRLSTFITYVIIIAAVWIVSDILIYLSINGTYRNKDTKIYVSSPQVTVFENKATYVNGYVKGSIKNTTEDIINNKYLKIDMYSPRDVNLGTKYVRIDNLQTNQSQDFEMWYKYTDVNYVVISITDDVQNVSEDAFLSQKANLYFLVGTLMFLYLL